MRSEVAGRAARARSSVWPIVLGRHALARSPTGRARRSSVVSDIDYGARVGPGLACAAATASVRERALREHPAMCSRVVRTKSQRVHEARARNHANALARRSCDSPLLTREGTSEPGDDRHSAARSRCTEARGEPKSRVRRFGALRPPAVSLASGSASREGVDPVAALDDRRGPRVTGRGRSSGAPGSR